MQSFLALLIVALAVIYLIDRVWRYVRADSQAPGCGSACGGCKGGAGPKSVVSIQLPGGARMPAKPRPS